MQGKIMLRRILHSKQFIMGLTLVLILCFIAIFADQLAPHDPNEYHPDARLQKPEWFSRGMMAISLALILRGVTFSQE